MPEQVASALDLVVHQSRLPDGRRRIVELAAVAAGPEGPVLTSLCTRTRDGDGVAWTPASERWAAAPQTTRGQP